jgi:hypothetical protein
MKSSLLPCYPTLPSARVGASHRLELRPHAFLNQLLHFDRPTLVVRSPGLSLCLETEFGVFFECDGPRVGDAAWLEDPVSGLCLDPSAINSIVLYGEQYSPPAFEISLGEAGFVCAIRPRADDQACQVMNRIIRNFGGAPTDGADLRDRGAGAWLDQWSAGHARSVVRLREASGRWRLDASILSGGIRLSVRLDHALEDRDGDILRLVDQERNAAAYLDLGRPGIVWDGGAAPELASPTACHHAWGR